MRCVKHTNFTDDRIECGRASHAIPMIDVSTHRWQFNSATEAVWNPHNRAAKFWSSPDRHHWPCETTMLGYHCICLRIYQRLHSLPAPYSGKL